MSDSGEIYTGGDDGEGMIQAATWRRDAKTSVSLPNGVINLSTDHDHDGDATIAASGKRGVEGFVRLYSTFDCVHGDTWTHVPLTPAAARALASQLLTAADAAEAGESFSPEYEHSQYGFGE